MSAKKRRKDELPDSDSDSGSNLADSLDAPMDSESPALDSRPSPTTPPGPDPRSSLTSDLGPSQTTAPGTDPRSSPEHARNTDPGTTQTTTCFSVWDDGPYLQPNGSYLIIKPKDEKVSFRRINIFWPTKYFRSICGAENLKIETPADGSLIVRTQTRAQTKALLKCTNFCEKAVTVSLHPSRNSTKGTIFAPEMRFMTEAEIMEGLRPEGVSHVRRLTTFRNGERKDTSLLVLTFETTTLPDTLLAGHIRYSVRVFIPNPLRCFACQRFGHSTKFCKQTPRCKKCGETPHDGSPCSAPIKCLSCNSTEHDSSSNECPVWKREKEICAVKVTRGISYPEARRTVEKENHSPSNKTYAKATKPQTATTETQTDPIPKLPPLKVLSPIVTEESAVSTQTAEPAEPVAPAPRASNPSPVQNTNTQSHQSVTQAPRTTHSSPVQSTNTQGHQATARPGAWQTVRGKNKPRLTNTGKPQPHPQSPADMCHDEKSRSKILKVPHQVYISGSWVPKVPRQVCISGSWVPKVPCQVYISGSWVSRVPRPAYISGSRVPKVPRQVYISGSWVPKVP